MNRRYFLGSLASIIGIALARNTQANSNYHRLLDEFIEPYTHQVGKTVIAKGDTTVAQYALKSNIDSWLLIDDKIYITKINELIESDLSSSQFCEINGWVITKTEALISAIILGIV